MSKIFQDNAMKPIIAFDFDGTLTDSNIFPQIGQPRKYAKEVTTFLYELGVIVLIWTCRDRNEHHDDIAPAVDWMSSNQIKYHDINTCIAHAPFHYEARKIYAHMYVDDKAFGWEDYDIILIDVLDAFLHQTGKFDTHEINDITMIIMGLHEEGDMNGITRLASQFKHRI